MATSSSSATAAVPVVTFEDLDNSVRNGKKKLYWSAFEVVLATAQPQGAPVETRYDAYQVNHNHLKKLHAGARGGPHYVRVECKYCTAPRFTQSITVSTKKFEEHYMTLHALDALATADAKKAQQQHQQRKSHHRTTATTGPPDHDHVEPDGERDHEDGDGDDNAAPRVRAKRARKDGGGATPVAGSASAKRPRRGAAAKDDDDHVAAMQGAAAAVVALSGGTHSESSSRTQPATTTTLPSSLVDSSIVLDPADSDTKRAKKSYWTAYEVVICERVQRSASAAHDIEASAASTAADEMVMRETRQDAWRVNHNALRRLHLDPANDTTVRVECRFCSEPKFNQSITVSTRKFEQHYYYEHGDETQRQELEERLAAKAAADAAALTDGAHGVSHESIYIPKRRKSWKALLMDRENAAAAAYATGAATGKAPYAGVGGSHARGVVSARHQRTLLVDWMLHDYLPLSMVESDRFQAFVGSLDRKFELPQPQALHKDLQQRYGAVCETMKKQIEEELKSGTAFVLAVDQFPVRRSAEEVAHVLITVHYISHQWERKQLVLACRPVITERSPEATWKVVQSVLDEFGFPVGAFTSATVHSDEVIDQALECLSPTAAHVRKPTAVVTLCAASALQTVVEAGLSILHRDVVEFQPVNSVLQQQAFELSTWTDLHAAVNSIVLRCKASAGTEVPPPVILSAEAITTAQAITELFEPFVRIAEDMSSTAYPTVPMIFQYFRHMKETITQRLKASETTKDQLAPVAKAMHTALNDLYHKVVHSKALIAYVLDPRFRFAHISSSDESSIRSRIAEVVTAMKGESEATVANGNHPGHSHQEPETTGTSTRQTRSLFEELATSGKRISLGTAPSAKQDVSTADATTLAELDEYLSLEDEDFNVNVLQWWQTHKSQFPTLAQVARRYLALVGTSLPAAELFTRVGQQLVARRCALNADSLEATIVVRASGESVGQPQTPQARVQVSEVKRSSPLQSSQNVGPPIATEATPVQVPTQGTNNKDTFAVIV